METAGSACTGASPPWRISSYCNGGSCVRVASWGQVVLLGDTKAPDGPAISFTRQQWRQFIAQVKSGEHQGGH